MSEVNTPRLTAYEIIWGARDKEVIQRTPISVLFINELHNEIHLKIYDTAFKGHRRVNIVMEGPTSISRNIITNDEANALRELLNRFFGEKS